MSGPAPRSYLYVPADQPDKLEKAATLPADALIVDLEDSVGQNDKQKARSGLRTFLAGGGTRPPVWVRVNASLTMREDARALDGLTVAGVVVPKVSSIDDVARAAALLPEGTPICALIETAAGVLDARTIASAPGVVRLAIGEADLSAELSIEVSPDGHEFHAMRSQIVLASAAAGIAAPVAPVSTDFRDLDALRASTEALRRMGFTARAAIHPAQLQVINDAFTPSAEDIERARRIVERVEAAGGAATTDDDGTMLDEAVVRAARNTLARARAG